MKLDRRQALRLTAGVAALAAGGGLAGFAAGPAFAKAEDAEAKIMEMFGKKPEAGKIALKAPEIAENGNTVPVSVSVDSAMEGDDLVRTIAIFAEGNPVPEVVNFHFTAMSGSAAASTRMRLAKTQNVVAVAQMANGDVFMDKKQVKVTIGGCGG